MTTNQKPVIVIGAGGHAKVLADLLIAAGRNVLGCIDPKLRAGEHWYRNICCLGDDAAVAQYGVDEVELVNGIGSLPKQPNHRKVIFLLFQSKGYAFATLVHPTAIVSPSAKLAEGVQVMAGCIVQAGCKIQQNVIVNTRASIDHDSVIAAHCHISPGAVLCGQVQVGENSHVGANATVIQGINIGTGAVVAAGTTLVKDLADGLLVKNARTELRKL